MPEMPVELEVSRLTNLTKGFGWDMTEQKLEDDKIVVVLKKTVKIEPQAIPE